MPWFGATIPQKEPPPKPEDWSVWRCDGSYKVKHKITGKRRKRCWHGVEWGIPQCRKPAYPGSKAGLCLPHHQARADSHL